MEAGNALDFSCKYFCFLSFSFRVQGAQTSATLRVDITEVSSVQFWTWIISFVAILAVRAVKVNFDFKLYFFCVKIG